MVAANKRVLRAEKTLEKNKELAEKAKKDFDNTALKREGLNLERNNIQTFEIETHSLHYELVDRRQEFINELEELVGNNILSKIR